MQYICDLQDISPGMGVCALFEGKQVAIFRIKGDRLFAVSNFDPFSQANVLSRGLVGNLGEQIVVASPIYKQHFDLASGVCIEDAAVRLDVFSVFAQDNKVYLGD